MTKSTELYSNQDYKDYACQINVSGDICILKQSDVQSITTKRSDVIRWDNHHSYFLIHRKTNRDQDGQFYPA